MSSFGDQWGHQAHWKRQAAYRVSSRNGAIAFWIGAMVLTVLFYSAAIRLIVTRFWS